MKTMLEVELHGPELWRRQCARNVMDCYALGMESLSGAWESGGPGPKALEALTRLMVEGMMAVRSAEDEKSFYRMAAATCRECAEACGEKGGMFRIYGTIFDGMTRNGGRP